MADRKELAEAWIAVTVAPLMAARRDTAEQVTQAILGARVTVLERSTRWCLIRMLDEYEGWIAARHLRHTNFPAPEWVTITDLWVNLRTAPDYRMPQRLLACIGTTLPLNKRRDGWLGIRLPGGQTGWLEEHRARVHAIDFQPPQPCPDELLDTAQRFLGVPYLWGGCSPFGLDCSGFVQLVYRLHGIPLPRDADQQAKVGSSVTLPACDRHLPGTVHQHAPPVPTPIAKTPSAGDAVFFGAPDPPHRINHVGLSIGDGTFIHAAGSDRVRINSLDDSPYSERLVLMRRYLAGASTIDC